MSGNDNSWRDTYDAWKLRSPYEDEPYEDEPDDECHHDEYEVDILVGRSAPMTNGSASRSDRGVDYVSGCDRSSHLGPDDTGNVPTSIMICRSDADELGSGRVTMFRLPDIDAMYRDMASIPELARGQVWCRTCGGTRKVDSAQCLRHGWPKCCRMTMTIDSPEWEAGG